MLVLPSNSADAEHVEGFVRIRFNGAKDIKQFPAAKYARLWIKDHIRTDDPTRRPLTDVNVDLNPDDYGEEVTGKKYFPRTALF